MLDKNKIRHVDFGSLLPLVNLRELRVEENGLKSRSNFAPLPRLQVLDEEVQQGGCKGVCCMQR